MYSTFQRLNSISALATTVVLCLVGLISLTTFLIPSTLQPGEVSITNLNLVLGRSPSEIKPREFAYATFNIQSDLTPLFNWNTKQLFVYITADYSTSEHPQNSVVIWDRIVRRKQDANLSIRGAKNKYHFKEVTRTFANVSATFALHYNVMPYTGVLTYGEAARSEEIPFPPLKSQVK